MAKSLKFSLQKLTLDYPTRTGFLESIKELQSATDRAAALLAVAFVDTILQEALARKMVKFENKAWAVEIFSGSGCLGSTWVKAQLCYAFAIIGKEARSNIKILTDVRNAFAHAPQPLSFENDIIKEACLSLNIVEKIKEAGHLISGEFTPREDTRSIFLNSCLAIYSVIAGKIRNGFESDWTTTPPYHGPIFIDGLLGSEIGTSEVSLIP